MQAIPRKSDKWIPWYFVAFFVVLAILDGAFVTIALSTHRGVVTDNAYQKGLNYNQTIAASERQDALGWAGTISFESGMLLLALSDKDQVAIKEANVTAYISRPAQAGFDFSVPLELNTEGVYSNNVIFPTKGLWNVRIMATWQQQQYQKSQNIVVR